MFRSTLNDRSLTLHWTPTLLAVLIAACDGRIGPTSDPDRALLGGETTVFETSQNAFGYAARNATSEHRDRFVVGNSFFKQNWVTAPASTEARDGLGPLFNARSCSACHLNDGRGRPPLEEGEPLIGLLFRFSNAEGGPDSTYGGQLQPFGVLGVPGEGSPRITRYERRGRYADGTPYFLEVPEYSFDDLAYGPLEAGFSFSPRVAPQVIGLGLLEAISEDTILELADPTDADGDDISGRPNWLETSDGARQLGRFGWKANQPNLREQIAGAFLGDMGITSSLHRDQDCTETQVECRDAATGGALELDDARLRDVLVYSMLLAVPARRDVEDEQAARGEALFFDLGCATCHVAELRTGSFPEFPELAHQTIRPYTDLLLHDMGRDLADQRPDQRATGSEWRTPPLWGLGLLQTVSHHTRLLHDGRARNAEEAILWHGGEAERSRDDFKALAAEERSALLRFLDSL